MSNDWDLEDNSVPVAEQARATINREFSERLRQDREDREAARDVLRQAQGNFVPHFLSLEELNAGFVSCSTDHENGRSRWVNSHGISYPWSANKLFIVCHACGNISYKLTDDISELQKCPAYNCRSRNITVLRSAEISLAVRNTDYGVNMTEVYHARRERLREQRAQRAAERRNN